MNDLFLQHSNICKLVSLLIKHHTTTLCKHVPTVEMIIKCKDLSMIFFHFIIDFVLVLLQSVVYQAKEKKQPEENLIAAARDLTKYLFLS